jgi:hypothetical protein
MLNNIKKFFLAILFFSFFSTNVLASEYLRFEPSKFSENNEIVIDVWSDKSGLEKLNRSQYKNDFYQLTNYFQTQINPFYCGVATSVIILNALRAPKDAIQSQSIAEAKLPEAFGGGVANYEFYLQSSFLNEKTDKIKDREIIELKNLNDSKENLDPGLNLDQLAQILKTYKVKVTVVHAENADEKSINKFRNTIKKVLNDQTSFIEVNFDSGSLGLKTFGHHSPLAAYDSESDSVLVMDVSYKRPWYWVPVTHLYKAMNTKDGYKYRGYLIISE